MKKTVVIFFTIVLICILLLSMACNSEYLLTKDYWAKALPIVKKQIEEVGEPYAKHMIEITPGMQSGNYEDIEMFFLVARYYYPYLGEAMLELSKLNPPTEATSKWQIAQLEAWSLRSKAFVMYMNCWDYNNRVLIGSDEDLMAADKMFEDSQTAGKLADQLQLEMLGQTSETISTTKSLPVIEKIQSTESNQSESTSISTSNINSVKQENMNDLIYRFEETKKYVADLENAVANIDKEIEDLVNKSANTNDKQTAIHYLELQKNKYIEAMNNLAGLYVPEMFKEFHSYLVDYYTGKKQWSSFMITWISGPSDNQYEEENSNATAEGLMDAAYNAKTKADQEFDRVLKSIFDEAEELGIVLE